ncbi:unannotated protein [freshwater metagenome]|uniref:Unannotated protein n=1 Tax=freshwater metagenome TaxID=449393 RepID=A0A6J7EUJ7_9ZZZZ|nr:hypothetical protein [Actinomycetota bacterium]
MSAYWHSRWPGEDGGPRRQQVPLFGPGLDIRPGSQATVTSRDAMASTMVVLREPGEVYLLRHTMGVDTVSWVEQIDPETLEPIRRSPDLPGGPMWPGGMAAHANGSLYVVFGRYAHRLSPELEVLATRELPRDRPYNSFAIMPDGHIATKDFAGERPLANAETDVPSNSELLILEPDELEIVARLELPEASIARISMASDDIYVVGEYSLMRIKWNGALTLDDDFNVRYRTLPGQTYGWDPVIAASAAWFLDNGEGGTRYAGTMRGAGISEAPLHLVRIDLVTGAVTLTEICGLPNGLIVNPPLIDPRRQIAVGYDSGNGVMAAFSFDDAGVLTPLWSREQNHACHMMMFADSGELVTNDHDPTRFMDQFVVLDITTGNELLRADSGSPAQSVLFPAPGFDRDVYLCTFTTVSRLLVR